MKIFGHPGSTCTRKVLMTLHENGAPFEFVLVDFAKGEHKQPAHLARQPFGQVPALQDEDFSLYESRAMARYIDGKFAGKLTPKDARAHAMMEQWISIETSNFSPHAMKFIYQYVFKREQPAEVLKAAGDRLDLAFSALDGELAKKPYLAGDGISLADICFAPYLEYLGASPAAEKIGAHPHVARWWRELSARPTWKKTVGRD
ncbi:MAG TPA: glutathione binding-like protein [Polyangiaceae bacterium]|jgi:glutathione S-transferase|nr:glutathione binding-like protein [Polyangiaceae bacterium]